MGWVEIRIPVNEPIKESIVNFLFEQNTTGCVDEENEIISYFNENDFNESLMSELTLYMQELTSLGFPAISESISIKNLPDQDWNQTWREQFSPVKVTSRFVIVPPWLEYQPQPHETIVLIDPKMAFGTGTHTTTQLMIRAEEKYVASGQTVLDVGTGTGILSIVAWYLGAGKIIGIDNDQVAIECARDSLVLNNCQDRISLRVGTIALFESTDSFFDIILTNLQRDVILNILKSVEKLLVENGKFIASGILLEESESVIKAVEKYDFELLERATEDEWCALVFKKR